MSQATPQGSAPRRAQSTATPPDLDALLESLNVEPRTPTGAAPTPPPVERPAGDVMARRVQALIRAFDILHKQVGAIAAQGETISKVAENQTRDAKAIGDLQRNVRYLRAIVIQQLQQSSNATTTNLPPIHIKLVVGHLVEQYQQAERDVAVLSQWAMLFVGVALGMAIAGAVSVTYQLTTGLIIFTTSALGSLAVALIFGGLARGARSRAALARRNMDESTLLRTVGTQAAPEVSAS